MKFICINCWRVIADLDAYVECPECNNTDDEMLLMDALDQERMQGREFTSFLERLMGNAEVKCPDHPEARLDFFCKCGEPLLTLNELPDDTIYILLFVWWGLKDQAKVCFWLRYTKVCVRRGHR
ncbi:hypothetical protein TI05_01575 [Achromatium sp. WMS3]|nr:hypothetical protein TI05_01575 [Achromatium sp. WMS3]